MHDNTAEWFDSELNNCTFKDERLKKRFRIVLENLWSGIGKPIPLACGNWSNTNGAYRFLSNERIIEDEIMQGHFKATSQRFKETKATILVLQDTTEFSYKREDIASIGITKLINRGKNKYCGKAMLEISYGYSC